MSKYWEERSIQREIDSQVIADKYLARMDSSLKQAQQDIIRQIEAFYGRYANDNRISLKEAKKYLTSKEMKEFKDVDLKRFREMSLSGNPRFENLLNAISYRVRISRLEALNIQIEMIMLQLYGGTNGLQAYTYTGLAEVYQNTYYHFMYDLAQAGVAGTVQVLTDDTMKEILSYNWSGKEFSSRIWGQHDSTIASVRKALEKKFAAGHSIDRTTKAIVDATGVAKSRAEALVRTESNFFHNLAAQNSYIDSEIERYEILATLDMRTSDTCREQDNKIYRQNEYNPGTTAPPFHVRCRTTTIPYFDESEYVEGEKRQSKDGPIDSISYEEWYQKYLIDIYGQETVNAMEKKVANESSDKKQHERYKEILGEDVPKSFAAFQDMKYTEREKWIQNKSDYRKLNAYGKIVKNEPRITVDLLGISKTTGVDLVGLDYRIKTKDSYLRKVNSDSNNSFNFDVIDKTIATTNDVIRYTYQTSHSKLVDKYFEINQELADKGYKLTKIKNTWTIKHSPYKGVNCNYLSPSGQGFEIQYHTPESFELKNGELHKLYEEWRLLKSKASPEAVELSKRMEKLSSNLIYPSQIDKVR